MSIDHVCRYGTRSLGTSISVIPDNEKPGLIVVQGTTSSEEQPSEAAQKELIEQPAKVMRIGTMIKQLLDEVKSAPLDEKSRARLREIYETSIKELADGLAPDLRDELERLVSPFEGDSAPSEAELRIAQAQLVGWLEGIFHGIQATLFAQQMAARAQLEQMRGRPGLPPGEGGGGGAEVENRPGTYL